MKMNSDADLDSKNLIQTIWLTSEFLNHVLNFTLLCKFLKQIVMLSKWIER